MKAMVLCAGYGTRLGDLTSEIPKPMLPITGHPLLAYILANLRQHGFDKIAVNLHFKPDAIRDYFGDGSRWGVSLHYSQETELLGTAGGMKNVEDFFQSEPAFLVHYGDVLTDQDLGALMRFHSSRNALATLLLHQRLRSNSIVTLNENSEIVAFRERPPDSERHSDEAPWVNSGICICSREVLQLIPSGASSDLPRDIFTKLAGSGRLFGFPLSGYRCAIDSRDRLEEARRAISDGRCRVVPQCLSGN
jgi:NDP-sugar pyrophosphorylase family protein